MKKKANIVLTALVVILPLILGSLLPDEEEQQGSSSKLYEETHLWQADEIDLPHLKDGRRYTSNPDNIVTPNTVTIVDSIMKCMDDELGIESAVVVVNHIYNDDPFRFAQDLFDLNKIGRDDRGLVIVLAYGDHAIRTHTGYNLEADLTDVESSRLQNDYCIPWMREEQPDSGLISLVQAIYQTLRAKQIPDAETLMPTRHGVRSSNEDEEFTLTDVIALLWVICIIALIAINSEGKSGFIGGGGFGGFSGGGGRSWGGGFGGGYGGGGSGGGGATSRW